MTGYELTQHFQAATGWVWSAQQSQIYPALRSMEARGLVVAEESVRGQRLKRRSYTVTEAGSAELREWLTGPIETPATKDSVCLRALFFDTLGAEAADKALHGYLDELRGSVRAWEEHRDRLRNKDTPLVRQRLARRPSAEHDRMVTLKAHAFQGLIDVARARITWCERLLELLHDDMVPSDR